MNELAMLASRWRSPFTIQIVYAAPKITVQTWGEVNRATRVDGDGAGTDRIEET